MLESAAFTVVFRMDQSVSPALLFHLRSDPASHSEFSDMLYLNDDFTIALSNALEDNGIFVAQVGEADNMVDPGAHLSKKQAETTFMSNLIKHGFESIAEYDEAHGGFLGVWSFLVAFHDTFGNAFNSNQAEIDAELRWRAMETKDGSSPFRFFDGATMMSYQFPSRVSQEVFCRTEPTPAFCDGGHGFDPERPNVPVSSFEPKHSAILNAGRGLYSKVDIAKGSYLAIDEAVHDMILMPTTTELIRQMHKSDGIGKRWEALDAYMFAYGFETEISGGPAYSVDPGISTFSE